MEKFNKYFLIVAVHYIYAIFWFLGDFPFPIKKYVIYADYIVALSAIVWMIVFYKKNFEIGFYSLVLLNLSFSSILLFGTIMVLLGFRV